MKRSTGPSATGDSYDSYRKAVQYVESFLPATGFERWKILLDRFGNPHQRFRSVHVAGTSGKGSVVQMAGEILLASGLKTGVHVKPYVQSATENISIDGRYVSPAAYARLIEEVKPVVEGFSPQEYIRLGPVTWGEVTKLLPLVCFAEQGVDYGVVEAGVGGRDDLTNVLTPEVSVITSVGMDHSETLGGTLDVIAHQKAGIIKDGVPAVTAARQPKVLKVISGEANRRHSRLSVLGRDFYVRVHGVSLEGTRFDYRSKDRRLEGIQVRMAGRHQAANAAAAIKAVDSLKLGRRVSDDEIRAGLASARLPGRFELVQDGPPVVLDVAHNVQKMRVLVKVLAGVFKGRRAVFVVAFLEGKDARRMIGMMARDRARFVFTSPRVRGKKPIDPELLKTLAESMGSRASVDPDPMSALDAALSMAGRGDVVCVTGSLYLVGRVRDRWFPERAVVEGRTSYP